MTRELRWVFTMVCLAAPLACELKLQADERQARDRQSDVVVSDGRLVSVFHEPGSSTATLEFPARVEKSRQEALEDDVDAVFKQLMDQPAVLEAQKVYVHVLFPEARGERHEGLTIGFTYERGEDSEWYPRAGFRRERRLEPVRE